MNPDSHYGFGTPNMLRAYYSITRNPVRLYSRNMEIWPNPFVEQIRIRIHESGVQPVRLYDLDGRIAWSARVPLPGEISLPPGLPSGIYILEIRTGENIYRSRLVKL